MAVLFAVYILPQIKGTESMDLYTQVHAESTSGKAVTGVRACWRNSA